MKTVWLITVVAFLAGINPALSQPNPAPAEVHKMNTAEMAMFKLAANHKGQKRQKLVLDPILCKTARAKAMDMAKRGYFAHVSPDGKGANYLVIQAGFELPAHYDHQRSGNNIESLAINATAPAAFAQWMGSPLHRDHILGELAFFEEQTSVGIGSVTYPPYPGYRYFVFLSAPPNPSKNPPRIVLKNPSGKTITTTWALIP